MYSEYLQYIYNLNLFFVCLFDFFLMIIFILTGKHNVTGQNNTKHNKAKQNINITIETTMLSISINTLLIMLIHT